MHYDHGTFSATCVHPEDRDFWMSLDGHTSAEGFAAKVFAKSGYVLRINGAPIGLMHYSLLWDNTPFLNFLYLTEEFRGQGYGRQAMLFWEDEMRRLGYRMTLISTQVDEAAQHFYRRLGYVDCGGLVLHDTPLKQPMEMFMRKVL